MAKLKVVPAAPIVIDDDDDEPDCPRCPPVGAPAWMATFADMATLLMAFFVLIIAFANFDEVSFKKMTGALREHFGTRIIEVTPHPESTTVLEMDFRPASTPPSPVDSPETEPETSAGSPSPEVQELAELLQEALKQGQITVSGEDGVVTLRLPESADAKDLATALGQAASDLSGAATQPPAMPGAEGEGGAGQEATASPGDAGSNAEQKAAIAEARLRVALRELEGQGLVDVQKDNEKVIVTVGAGGAFRSGSSDLTAEAREIMSRIALAATGDNGRITVTGHTDDVPLSGGPFTDNWGLAAARASSVVRELGATGAIDQRRLSAVSKGESAPVADNTTDAGRAANRRIEIEFDYGG
jgi:chemotaxis protein MotB